jgi:hypothetical protein
VNFADWFDRLDRLCLHSFGMSIMDLPDMNFRDAFDDGITPDEFMAEILPDPEALREVILS